MSWARDIMGRLLEEADLVLFCWNNDFYLCKIDKITKGRVYYTQYAREHKTNSIVEHFYSTNLAKSQFFPANGYTQQPNYKMFLLNKANK